MSLPMLRLQVFENLPLGGKVYLGFGTATMLFALVIYIFHNTLFDAVADHERLLMVQERTKSGLMSAHQHLLAARQGEKDFLAKREEALVRSVHARLDDLLAETEDLSGLEAFDGAVARTAARIRERVVDYRDAFDALVDAWRIKGFDHRRGLQGRFRDTIHEVEDKARNYNVSHLHRTLLEVRRAEKDTGLRRQSAYIERTQRLVESFLADVGTSELDAGVQAELIAAMQAYRQHYRDFARFVMAGEPLHGGMGAYRDAAHVVEGILVKHFVPDFETNILLLRRWEKDYLLRNDPVYVERHGEVLERLRGNILKSEIAETEKHAFGSLLTRYQHDFHALVAQNARVAELQLRLERDVEEIEALVGESVAKAIAEMDRVSEETRAYSVRNARIAVAVALAALAMTILFTEYITRRITSSLSTLMAITAVAAAGAARPESTDDRDEVKAFARALGSMSKHIASLHAQMDRTERELTGLAAGLAAAAGQPNAADMAGRGTETASRLDAAAEQTARMADRLKARVEALAAAAAVQEEMIARLRERSR